MIKLLNLFSKKPLKKEDIVKSNTWTHATHSEELMKHLKNGGKYIGSKEDLSKFNITIKGPFRTSTNQHAPNFKKGSIFSGYEISPYLITTDLPDSAFQPNWNSTNYNSFEDSQNVGVLKPEYRDAKHFKLWMRTRDGKYTPYLPI